MSILDSAARPARRKSRPLEQKNIDLTQGPILKGMALFFLPILLGSLMQQLYVTVDAIVIGQFVGKAGLAAVDCVFNLCRLPVTFFVGLSAGAGIIVAQCFGSRSLDRLSKIIHTSMIFSVLAGLFLSALGILSRHVAISFLNVPEEIAPITNTYLIIYFAGLSFVTVYNLASGVLRAIGDSKTPFWSLGIASFINIGLDLLFVAVFSWGVAGAAIATLIAQACSALYVVVVMAKKRSLSELAGSKLNEDGVFDQIEQEQEDAELGIKQELEKKFELYEACRLSWSKMRISRQELKHVVLLGLPVAFQSSLYTMANMYVQSAANATGTDNIAAWSLVGKLDIVIWLILEALTIVVTTFCAQNYGAKKRERLIKGVHYAMLSSCLIVGALAAILYLLSKPLGLVFLGEKDIEIVYLASNLLAFVAPFYICIVPSEIWSSQIRATGHTVAPMVLTLLSVFGTRLLWTGLVVPNWPYHLSNLNIATFHNDVIHVVVAVYPVSWIAVTLCIGAYYLYFKHRYLKDKQLPEPRID